MKNMETTEETIYPSMRIAQLDVGELAVDTMAYSSIYPAEHICFSHEITIRGESKDSVGWGNVIFRGTLKELIDLVKTKVEVK